MRQMTQWQASNHPGSGAKNKTTKKSSKPQAEDSLNSRAETSGSKATPIEGDSTALQRPQLYIQPGAAKQKAQSNRDLSSNASLGPTINGSKGQAKDSHNSQARTSSSMPIKTDGVAPQSPQRCKSSGALYSASQQAQKPKADKSASAGDPKKMMFKLGGSSKEEGSLKSALSPRNRLTTQKKQNSFSDPVIMHTVDPDDTIDPDSECDYIDESAIDDEDDSSDWEDSIEDSGKSSVDDKYFQRVDSKVNLTSRRSLITLMLTQTEDRAKALSNHASQSTSAIPQSRNRNGPAFAVSPNDSDDAPLMMKGNRQPPLKPIREIPRSSAQPIPTVAHSQGQGALSPRTTRRNMLATELTESLRRHLLWERSQKSSTANAVLKRRHTSYDVANLKQLPEESCMKKTEDVNVSSWNQYFIKETFNDYHSKGW
ncbi:unnamed protein product [Clonostachys chloroleuca]|uniref:DUF3295 domain-containing protein n=1 Tax=Clonostachys chloroleuca TaxID=1926264 RepID=A0AA35LQ68_9HYPO|nr:unnamed protein product [Clonostachys chloroleuca]